MSMTLLKVIDNKKEDILTRLLYSFVGVGIVFEVVELLT